MTFTAIRIRLDANGYSPAASRLGTRLLAVAVTVIEVALIVSLMLAGGAEATALARDTVFAAVMIIEAPYTRHLRPSRKKW